MKAVWTHTAARRDSNPRGYERGIGPSHLRKGRHEPSSCACDIEDIEVINTGIGTEYGQWPHKMGPEPTWV
jgi:hypothetical protein